MWIYQNTIVETLPEDCAGFVYCITNTETGRKYIGKKLSMFSKTKYKMVTLKSGIKKRKKIKSKVDSDWMEYYGSSLELSADVKCLGVDSFTREILRFCGSKTELSYYEAKLQFEYDVLLDASAWYNAWISVRIRKFKLNK